MGHLEFVHIMSKQSVMLVENKINAKNRRNRIYFILLMFKKFNDNPYLLENMHLIKYIIFHTNISSEFSKST